MTGPAADPPIPPTALVLLVGPAASGKSTWARARFAPSQVVSSDTFRELVADDATDQGATRDAFRLLHLVAAARIGRGLLTVIDATHLTAASRKPLLALAARFGRPSVAVMFDVPLDALLARNATRDRVVPGDVVRRHHAQMAEAIAALDGEGYAAILQAAAATQQTGSTRQTGATPQTGATQQTGAGTIRRMPLPVTDMRPDLPNVRFTQRRLDNGLRVIVAPEHLAPVVAINLWYDVGSRHEVAGKTGFAHLFEHFMFQGSRHVSKSEHMSIIQGAGGVNNATTFFDRTNYFETLPSHELDLGLWLEADRMATLLDSLSQENLDNQRDVVKNEKRQSYDNRPYGSFYEKLMAAVFPADHPYHHTPIGSMEDLDAASLEDVSSFFRAWYAPNNAVLTIAGDVDEEAAFASAERWFGPIPANPSLGRAWPADLPPIIGREVREMVPDAVPLVRVHIGYRIPAFGTDEFDALEVGTQILAGGRGSRLYQRLVREERVAQDVAAFTLPLVGGSAILAGWVTARPESDADTVERMWHEETQRLATEPVSDDELARARALIESAELGAVGRMEEVADRLSQFATYFDRPELVNEQLGRYLAVDAARIQSAAAAFFRPDNRAVITYVPAEEPAQGEGTAA